MHFSVLTFCYLQAGIFFLKMGFWFVFNEDSNISSMIFQSQPHVDHTFGKKRTAMQNNFIFHETIVFSCKSLTLRISKINSLLDFKRNKILLENKSWELFDKFGKLHGSVALGIHMCVQMWNSFPEELKATKQKCNGKPFHEEKNMI